MDLSNLPKPLREQIPINQALVGSLIQCVPRHWRSAALRVEWSVTGTAMTVQVTSPDGDCPADAISPDLTAAAAHLDAHRTRYQIPWNTATFTIRATDEGPWEIGAEFE